MHKLHNQDFLTFLRASPTPFHAVQEVSRRLKQVGFQQLHEQEHWRITAQNRYFVTRNGSSLIAFSTGEANYPSSGWRIVGTHTDSPCLKVKPNACTNSAGYWKLGVEVYGGALLNPWFDRDLSLAGRIVVAQGRQLKQLLIDFGTPIAIIPSLAIHLDRNANNQHCVNPQTDISPLLGLPSDERTFQQMLLEEAQAQWPEAKRLVDYELLCYDTEPARLIGVREEFIAAAKLDNLLSCHAALTALTESCASPTPQLLVMTDHEEVGSCSGCGADGTFLKDVWDRIHNNIEISVQSITNSLLISADNAHALHPNFVEKHDDAHQPILNKGPVVKINANQRYATTSESAALIKEIARAHGIILQEFVMRNDLRCGSTIGPLIAGRLGVRTLDIGAPSLAMHSIRELTGDKDPFQLRALLEGFFQQQTLATLS